MLDPASESPNEIEHSAIRSNSPGQLPSSESSTGSSTSSGGIYTASGTPSEGDDGADVKDADSVEDRRDVLFNRWFGSLRSSNRIGRAVCVLAAVTAFLLVCSIALVVYYWHFYYSKPSSHHHVTANGSDKLKPFTPPPNFMFGDEDDWCGHDYGNVEESRLTPSGWSVTPLWAHSYNLHQRRHQYVMSPMLIFDTQNLRGATKPDGQVCVFFNVTAPFASLVCIDMNSSMLVTGLSPTQDLIGVTRILTHRIESGKKGYWGSATVWNPSPWTDLFAFIGPSGTLRFGLCSSSDDVEAGYCPEMIELPQLVVQPPSQPFALGYVLLYGKHHTNLTKIVAFKCDLFSQGGLIRYCWSRENGSDSVAMDPFKTIHPCKEVKLTTTDRPEERRRGRFV